MPRLCLFGFKVGGVEFAAIDKYFQEWLLLWPLMNRFYNRPARKPFDHETMNIRILGPMVRTTASTLLQDSVVAQTFRNGMLPNSSAKNSSKVCTLNVVVVDHSD